MRRILIRSPKTPFEVVPPEVMLRDNLLGKNSGNLLFLEAAWKLIDTSSAEVTPDRFSPHKLGADYINEHFDLYVIPLANAFRMRFQDSLARLTEILEKLTIPVVVLGVGLGGRYPYVPDERRSADANVTRFLRAVMDRSASIGVRGEFTEDYVRRLGFRDVEVIGCPSMYLYGDRIQVAKRTPSLGRYAKIAINITPRVRSAGPIVMSHLTRYPNLTFVAQASETLELMLYGRDQKGGDPNDPMPVRASHPLLRDGKTRYFVDPWPWLDYLRGQEFVFGTRIHGNVAPLLVGTPSFVLGHDARTMELARYFEMPHRFILEVPADIDAADLYAEADYGPLVAGHPARFRAFTDYLERNGVRHVFERGEDPCAFDRRVAEIRFPPSPGLHRRSPIRRLVGRAERVARALMRATP